MLARYEPWNALNQLRSLNRNVLNSFGDDEDGSNVVTSRWMPAVDIKEEDDRYVIHADVPGVLFAKPKPCLPSGNKCISAATPCSRHALKYSMLFSTGTALSAMV